jgi:tripartite-type tricarboxylate transporter receptor subunit TctC
MAPARNPQFPNIPTLGEEMGNVYASGAWRGIAAPKGLPADVTAKLGAALKTVYDSAGYREFMSGRGFGMKWADAAGFASFMDEADKQMGEAMKAAGLAKAT